MSEIIKASSDELDVMAGRLTIVQNNDQNNYDNARAGIGGLIGYIDVTDSEMIIAVANNIDFNFIDNFDDYPATPTNVHMVLTGFTDKDHQRDTSATPVTDDGPVDDSSANDIPTDGVQADNGGAGKDHQAAISLKQNGEKLDLNGECVDSNGDKDGDAELIVPRAKQSGDDIAGNLGDVFHDSDVGMTSHEEPADGDAGDFLLS